MNRPLLLSAAALLVLGCQETDPVFHDSPAGSATLSDIERWNSAYGWGDHASAGYLSSEEDPRFAASAAAEVTAADVDSWRQTAAYGDHAAAGYLSTEADPLFAAAPASGISATDVARWDAAAAWGDHTLFGYATESDLAWTQGNGHVEARPGGAIPEAVLIRAASNASVGGNPLTHAWQSFTPLADTTLVRVEADLGPTSTVEVFTLREGTGYAGAVLYSAPIADPVFVALALPSLPVRGGQTYSLVFSRQTPGPLGVQVDSRDPYPHGISGRDDILMTGSDLALVLTATAPVVVTNDARVGIHTASPTAPLDIAGDTVRLRSPKTPASATAPCERGEVSWDPGYVYVCVNTNSWRRAALSAW